MYDVIKIRLKKRDESRSGKENQPLNIKTAVERPILKLGLPKFRSSNFTSRRIPPFRRIFMTSHMPVSSASTWLLLVKILI